MKTYLISREQKIKIDCTLNEYRDPYSRVPRDIFCPILFLINTYEGY